jgi:hypothetical protein
LCYFKLSRNEAAVFLIVLVLTVAAKGAALFPLFYSIDSYVEILSPSYHADSYMQRLSQGRFGQALLNKALTLLGASPPLTNTFYSLLCMICFVWVGLIVCRLWKVSDDLAASFLVTSFISLHPYQAELFTFNSTPVYTASSLFFAFSAVYFSRAPLRRVIWTGLCLTLALSLYQTSLNFVAVSLAFAVILELTRERSGGDVEWHQIAARTRLWPRLATLGIGLASYLVLNKTVQWLFGVKPATRAQFIAFSEGAHRLAEAKDATIRMFALPEPLLPVPVKFSLALIILIALVLAARNVLSSGLRLRTGLAIAVLLYLLVLCSAAGIFGVTLVTQSWWPVPRIVSAMSFFQAGLLALGLLSSGPKLRAVLVATACLVLFAFIGINNHIFTDQLRVNLRDIEKASRIVARLEDHPGFAQVQHIAVIGGSYAFRSPIYTMHGDLNISALYAPWSQVPILNEVSGYSFGEADAREEALAVQHCKYSPNWPAAGSVTISGSLAIVCQ